MDENTNYPKDCEADIEPASAPAEADSVKKGFDLAKIITTLGKKKVIAIISAFAIAAVGVGVGVGVAVNNGKGGNNDGKLPSPDDNIPCTHSFGEWITETEAGCTTEGTKYRKCMLCEEKESETVSATGHQKVVLPAVQVGCVENGLTEGEYCEICNTVLVEQEEIVAEGHRYSGDDDETCDGCDYIRDVACKHTNTVVVNGRDATCTKTGLTSGKKCADCGETLVAQKTIAKTAHIETAIPAVNAKCTETGLTEGKICSACGKVTVEQEIVPQLNHSYDGKDCIRCDAVLEAGLYDAEDNLVASWDELTNTYGLSILTYYRWDTYRTNEHSGYSVLNNNPELSSGVKVVIPDNYDIIGDYAFANTNISCVVLPDKLKYIRQRAFSDCKNLSSVVIPEGVEFIDSYAFYCTAITSVVIPKNVNQLGTGIFYYCTSLTSVEIQSNKIYSLPYQMFGACPISEINIPEGVVRIENWSFAYTDIKTLKLPDSLEYIEDGAFFGCEDIEEIVIGSGLSEISRNAFERCDKIKSFTVSAENEYLKSEGGVVYSKDGSILILCPKITENSHVRIPDGVTTIASNAFAGNDYLEIEFPETLEVICSEAFYRTTLSEIKIPASVRLIESNAFSECAVWLTVDSNNEFYCSEGGALYSIDRTVLLQAPNLYDETFIVPDGVEKIDEGAFDWSYMPTIVIPTSVKSIGKTVFDDFYTTTICYMGSEDEWNLIDIDSSFYDYECIIIFDYIL